MRRLVLRYRDMASDVAWSGLSDGLSLAVNLVSFILLGRTLPLETYGGYLGTYGVIGPIGAFSWSGLTLLVLQRVIREGDDLAQVASRSFTLTFVQGVAAATLSCAIASVVISQIPLTTIMLIAVAELVLFPITQTSAALLQSVNGFAAAARVRIAVPILRMVALLIPYSLGALTIQNLAFAWVIGFAFAAVASVAFVLPAIGLKLSFSVPSRTYLRSNLELSLPLTGSTLQTNGDKAVMNYFGLESDTGLYGAAYRIILLSQMPLRTMNQALFQRFLTNDDATVGLHLRRAKRFAVASLALSAPITVVLYFAAPFLQVLVGDKFSESVSIVRWLLPVVPLLAVSRAPLNGLLGLGKTTARAATILSSSALSMILYISLIPSLSWRGAIIGTIVSELYIIAVGWGLLVKHQRLADEANRHKRSDAHSEATDIAVTPLT